VKTLLAATLIGLTVMTSATSAAAYVVVVPTSFPARLIADDDELEAALESAVADVVTHAIAFSPTFVTVQTARVVGDRVYILLLIGDGDGEEMLKKLSDGAEAQR
jgi:ABC-type xylose transport system substrate-binding protein